MDRGKPAPSGVTLYEVLTRLEGDGWTGQFQARESGVIRCLACRRDFPASAEHADEMARIEGASDPDDMTAVVPLRCPHCGTRGTFVAHYGPGASADEADALAAFDRAEGEGRTRIAPPGPG